MTLLCASVHKRKEKNFIKDNLVQAYWAARDTMNVLATFTAEYTYTHSIPKCTIKTQFRTFSDGHYDFNKKVDHYLPGITALSNMSTSNSLNMAQQILPNKNAKK